MYKIISDGGCDFTNEEIKTYNVDVVPFYVSFEEEFLKVGIDITTEDFFKRLSTDKKTFPKTSQPNPQDYIDVFKKALEAGQDILALTVSSKLSGSYNSAAIAADLLKEEFPDREIIVIDTLSGSIAQGLILREVIKMRDAGLTLGKTARLTRRVLKTTQIYFTLDTVEYLKRGGRIGPTTALVGGMLGLRPILHLLDGEVKQLDNVRGKKSAFRLMEAGIVEALLDAKDRITFAVGHILSEKDALHFKGNIETSLGVSTDNPVTEVGAVIGAHAGPGAIAFAYCSNYETLEGEM